MSKAFAVKELTSRRVVMRTLDATCRVIVDDVEGTTIEASGITKVATLIALNQATAILTTDGGEIQMSIPSRPMSVVLDPSTNSLSLNSIAGRVIGNCGDFVMLAVSNVNAIADANVLQTLLSIRNNATLDPADPVYLELSNVDVPDLINSSRLNVVPDAAGTTIHSLFTNGGVDNVPHKTMWIMNTGTTPGQTLTLVNQSGTGTTGGLFFGPGDYVIPAGGGVLLLLDTHVTPDPTWVVYGR